MGGDGWSSPKARYEIDAQLAQDATGGVWSIVCTLDPQFMNLVALMQMTEDVAADTTQFSMEILAPGTYRVSGDLLKGGQDTNSSRVWAPPPIIDPSRITWRLLNATDTKIGFATATVYVFNKSAQHVVPIEQIFRCLPRGGSVN